jgi:C1A family cysteine protease
MMKTSVLLLVAVASVANAQDACHSAHTDEKSCLADTKTGGGCAWCKCGALPSACWTIADAARLPSGVYECTNSSAEYRFDEWAAKYSKSYESAAEEESRKSYFKKNLEAYATRNVEEGFHGAHYGPSQFSDLSEHEAKIALGGFRPSNGLMSAKTSVTFTADELKHARTASVDWRSHGAVTPVQQQHPFGTCWAFSMVAATEGAMVVQGKQELQKLSEQMVVSCVPARDCGQSGDVTFAWMTRTTGGQIELEDTYKYNRTCNFFREELLAPDGKRDGYTQNCTLPSDPPYGPCPPCPGITRRDGTPPCKMGKSFSNAIIKDNTFISIGPNGDSTEMMAGLLKYGPGQIGIDASCVKAYKSGIVSNCTTTAVDHAVTIVGAETDEATGLDYWIVKNSWDTTFGEEGYFRVARSTNPPQMGIAGIYFGCVNEGCKI